MTIMTFGLGLFPLLSFHFLWLAAGGAVCFVLYHWLGGYAYREGDLSVTYPLAQTAMLYIPLWGVLILGESLTATGVVGIVLIAFGAYCIQLRRLTLAEITRPFLQLGNRSVQAALLAGFVYSIGAVFDKTGVNHYAPFQFTYVMVLLMFALMSLNLLRPCYRGRIVGEWRHNPKLILLSGPVIMASFLSFRFGLQLAPVSYALPVRQVSLLIGVLIGIVFLGESFGRIRLASTLLILSGVFLVWHG